MSALSSSIYFDPMNKADGLLNSDPSLDTVRKSVLLTQAEIDAEAETLAIVTLFTRFQ